MQVIINSICSINTNLMNISLPTDKLQLYQKDLLKFKNEWNLTRPELQSLIGKLVYAGRVIQYGRVFYQHLLHCLKKHNSNSKSKIRLTKYAMNDINWWIHFIVKWNGIGMIPPLLSNYKKQDQHQLYTDASLKGMGGFFAGNQYTYHAWDTIDREKAKRK
jgi:hypothetical protein